MINVPWIDKVFFSIIIFLFFNIWAIQVFTCWNGFWFGNGNCVIFFHNFFFLTQMSCIGNMYEICIVMMKDVHTFSYCMKKNSYVYMCFICVLNTQGPCVKNWTYEKQISHDFHYQILRRKVCDVKVFILPNVKWQGCMNIGMYVKNLNGRPLEHQDWKLNTKLLQEGNKWRLEQELE